MTGQSSARPENSGKNKISSAANAGRSNMFAQEKLLATKYEILKENHDLLVEDYKILEASYKIVNDLNEAMKLHLPKMQNQPMKPDAKNLSLLKDLETERSEKAEYKKKMVEEMKRMESEKEAMINELKIKNQELLSGKEKEEEEYKKTMVEERKRMENEKDAMINELRIKNQELLIAKEKEEEEYKKMMVEDMKRMKSEKDAMINELMIKNQELLIAKEKEAEECKKLKNKFVELTEKFGAVETECSFLKSLFNAENAINQGGNDLAFKNDVIGVDDHNVTFKNEVIVVDDHNVPFKNEVIVVDDHTLNNTVADVIVISDESDAENDTPPRKSDITRQRSVGKKEEGQCSNGANPPKVNHQPLPSSSSSSSSDDHILVQLPVKRSRDDYNRS